jgi:large subunit ribosomal protein L5
MAEEKPDKAAKTPKAPKGEKGDKPPKGPKAGKKEKDAAAAEAIPAPPPRLLLRYENEVLPELVGTLGRNNRLSIPRLEKIVVNMGVGAAIGEKKYLEDAAEAMKQITGQQPIITLGRKSIAGFRLRQGMAIGCKVTLRGKRMWEFLDRLVSIALPRVRDFRGLSPNAFDGHGNYSIGLNELLVFPELNPDKFTRPQGMNVTLVTTARNDGEARELLKRLGVPMRAA